MSERCALGIDTSNYKTSVAAVTESGNIISDRRIFLNVKEGALGLRQSEALFQHVVNLPGLLEAVMDDVRTAGCRLSIVAASAAPRPQAGSYMPAFLAGMSGGRAAAAAAGCPYVEFSHQEGHIMAVKFYSSLSGAPSHISMHLSGGTTELLHVTDYTCCSGSCGNSAASSDNLAEGDAEDFVPSMNIEIRGGTKDISFGQLLDRVGQKMGFNFPAGAEIDRLALEYEEKMSISNAIGNKAGSAIGNATGIATCTVSIPNIILSDGWINLSGIETKAIRLIEAGCDFGELSYRLMKVVAETIVKMAAFGCQKCGTNDMILAGGVSSSRFIRKHIEEYLKEKADFAGLNIVFGDAGLSSDNAVGTALLGMNKLLQSTHSDV